MNEAIQKTPATLLESIDMAAAAADESAQEHVQGTMLACQVPATLNREIGGVRMPIATNAFGQKVVDLVCSRSFLQTFSNELGAPHEGESRDDFIQRGKELVRKLLRKALGG